jgi:hypothetical protein
LKNARDGILERPGVFVGFIIVAVDGFPVGGHVVK